MTEERLSFDAAETLAIAVLRAAGAGVEHQVRSRIR
jgi:hypothetical protein